MSPLTRDQITILAALQDERERTLTDIKFKSGLPECTIRYEMSVLTRRHHVLRFKNHLAFTIYRIGRPVSIIPKD